MATDKKQDTKSGSGSKTTQASGKSGAHSTKSGSSGSKQGSKK